jgi:hypothetical protein
MGSEGGADEAFPCNPHADVMSSWEAARSRWKECSRAAVTAPQA